MQDVYNVYRIILRNPACAGARRAVYYSVEKDTGRETA